MKKQIQNYVFVQNGEFLSEFGSFLLSLYPLMSLTLFFLLFLTTAGLPSAYPI